MKRLNDISYDRFADELIIKKWICDNRIFPRLIPNGECLEWGGANSRGYGQVRFYVGETKRMFSCHRIAVEVREGRVISTEEHALHHCDNPRCCRPEHLYAGTQKQNVADMTNRGRARGRFVKGVRSGVVRRGEAAGMVVMTDEKVREARAIYAQGIMGHKLLARKYKISNSAMLCIVRKKSWTHI